MTGLNRRQALVALGGGVLGLAGCGDQRRSVTASEVPKRIQALSFNVHPLGGRFETLQRDALRALAAPWIRVTLGLTSDTQGARPYVRMGPNVLGILSDFRSGPVDAAAWPDLVEAALRRYPEVRRAELLNDPERLNGLSPEVYVREFLRPGYERIRERLPGVAVVAAAPVSDRKRGPERFRRLTDAGADQFCDYRAVRVFFDDESGLAGFAGATGRPILVTETGTMVPGQHVRWYTEVIPRIRGALGPELTFWYVLLESASLLGGSVPYSAPGSSVIAPSPNAGGGPQAAQGSGLYPLLTGTAPA